MNAYLRKNYNQMAAVVDRWQPCDVSQVNLENCSCSLYMSESDDSVYMGQAATTHQRAQ